jgi:DNA polymerase III epsilon subunit-like protein
VTAETDIFLPRKKGYVVLDIESQGYMRFCPIEISVVRFSRDGQCLDRYTSLVRPRMLKVNPYVTQLTGITVDMVKNAPLPHVVFGQVRRFAKDSIVVGHAVGENDIPIVDHFYTALYHQPFTNRYVDTFYWAQQLFPSLGKGHYNLKALAEHFSITAKGFHRAEEDCFTTGRLYQILSRTAESLTETERRRVLYEFVHKDDPKETHTEHHAPKRYNALPVYSSASHKGGQNVIVTLWKNRGRTVIRLKFHEGVPERFAGFIERHPQWHWHQPSKDLWVAEKITPPQSRRIMERLRQCGCTLFRQS